MLLHLDLKNEITARYPGELAVDPAVAQDALTVTFLNGLVVELRYLNVDEYSMQWLWHEALLRIDTAPIHPELATFPNHFHDAEGVVKADVLTVPGREPWENVRALLDTILEEPLLC